MSNAPLMPMATAVWLVENTTLTFKQIADFCKLHEVEVQGIADGEVAKGIKAYNPIISGQLSREEIELSSNDKERPLQIKSMDIEISNTEKKIKKYIPLSKRQDKPDSALWLIKQHSLLKDSQIAKLVGVTKNSVTSIRNKSYWNYNNLNPKDPVALNLFTQKDLVEAIEKAERRIKKYIPLSKRQDKPDSALWLIKQHNNLKDSQIAKLVGVTKNSVTSIRNKSYWNYNNLNPKDPVALNLFSQKDLILAIEKAENKDYSLLNELFEVIKLPYDEQFDFESKWYQKRPDWAKNKVGCSMLSCSS